MIDAGAIFNFRRAGSRGVGSSNLNVDRSESSLQVLGAPVLLDTAGNRLKLASGATSRVMSISLLGWMKRSVSIPTDLERLQVQEIGVESAMGATWMPVLGGKIWRTKVSSFSTPITLTFVMAVEPSWSIQINRPSTQSKCWTLIPTITTNRISFGANAALSPTSE